MQNRYVGDIGDFGKYGLLRFLFKNSRLELGVNWYLVPDETGNADGKHISYLLNERNNHKRFRSCDSQLYDELFDIVKPKRIGKKVVSCGKRCVFEVEKRKLLDNCKEWARERNGNLKDAKVIFLDPDNGFQTDSCPEHYKRADKYVFYKDLPQYYDQGKSLIVYQHRTREKEEKYRERFKKIVSNDCISSLELNDLIIIRFKRFSVRDYIFILHPLHRKQLQPIIEEFLQSPWKEHFERLNFLDKS